MYQPGGLALTGVGISVPAWVITGSNVLAVVVVIFALCAVYNMLKIGDKS